MTVDPPAIPSSAANIMALASCVCEHVSAVAPLCWCGIYPGGLPSWEYCGECSGGACGMAYVSVGSIEPYTTFGVGDPAATCDTMLQAVVSVGVVRCLPVVEGGLPDEESMAQVALLMHADALAMREAIRCCAPADTILRSYTAAPAQGGCVGGEWEIILDLEA
jgi:hypothetical protein